VSIGDFAEQALKSEPAIVASRVVKYIEHHRKVPFVITGYRAPEEVAHTDSALSGLRNIKLIYVDSAEELRFQRSSLRGRADSGDRKKFRYRNQQESRMGLLNIALDCRAVSIQNDQSIANLHDAFTAKFVSDVEVLSTSERWAVELPRRELEDAILCAMWSEYQHGTYFTTAQIAKLINSKLENGQTKHKDNISRYFNQTVHPYFDITMQKSRRMYRLSGTGYSKAMLLKRYEK
jgi:hypothetical protein